MKTHQKSYVLISFFSVLIHIFLPFFILFNTYVFAKEPDVNSITYSNSKHTFTIRTNLYNSFSYQILYKTDLQIESIDGLVNHSNGTFEKDFFAGTCSSGGTCVPHTVIRGIYVLTKDNSKESTIIWFTIDNGVLTIVSQTTEEFVYSGRIEYWLNNGSFPPNPGFCGDNIIQAPELCDDGENNGKSGYCLKDCTGYHKFTICHGTSSETNPFVAITVDYDSLFKKGHDTHTDDIIPPFDYFYQGQYGHFEGLNWTPENIDILNNDCNIPTPPQFSSNVIVTKFNDLDADGFYNTTSESGLSGWDITLGSQTKTSTSSGEVLFQVNAGTFDLSENLASHSGWFQSNIYCGTENSIDNDNSHVVQVQDNQTVHCFIGNYQKANIIIKKLVVDSNNIATEDATVFEITPDNDLAIQPFSQATSASYLDIMPGDYSFSETNIPSPYQLVSITGDNDTIASNGATIHLNAGETKELTFVNTKSSDSSKKGYLTILKYNDTWPNNTNPGSDVVYTIRLKAQNGPVSDVIVTDLPPFGFTYKAGSWKAYKNGVALSIPEPQYHSPGKWYVGTMQEEDVVELVYTAQIASTEDTGLYKDLAWAYGCSPTDESCSIFSENAVLAQAQDSGKIDPGTFNNTTEYVGTKVNIISSQTDTKQMNVIKENKSSSNENVSGASTGLPKTGASTAWTLLGIALSLLGLLSLLLAFNPKLIKYMFIVFAVTVFSFFTASSAYAYSDQLMIRLEQPQSPTRLNNFSLTYTALDMEGQTIDVACFMKKPSSSFFQFGPTLTTKTGGNNGNCNLNVNDLSENGTYQFYATAKTLTQATTSEVITVDYNITGPGTPTSYSKERISNCEYKISFKTADDSKTTRVEIYHSTNTSFTADAGTRVKDMPISYNQYGSFNYIASDCDKMHYFAVRAFDAYGNGSDIVGDTQITVTSSSSTTTTTTSSTTTSNENGPIAVADNQSQVTNETASSTSSNASENTTEGDVQGAQSNKNIPTGSPVVPKEEVLGKSINTNTMFYIRLGAGILMLTVLSVLFYSYVKHNKSKKENLPEKSKA